MWFHCDQLPTLKEIENLEKTSTRDVTSKKGDGYGEAREDDEDNL